MRTVQRVLSRQLPLLRGLPLPALLLLQLLLLQLLLLLLPLLRLPARADSGLEAPLSSIQVQGGGRGKQRESSKAAPLPVLLALSERQRLLPLQHPEKLLVEPTPTASRRSRRLRELTGLLDVARYMSRTVLSQSICIG